ncbi:hypothetical protein LOTGIDRAFT_229151 [Lottia gigantea]|uniref:Uncharacterized protein n=1 Tax=Lottia gigantea TaxID=225164 RepID=V4A7J1_LOTGI|nr:hypothetical protein LOTGIDRAFT_229151 [Lottia gigantea]ESO89266.1 hypothetical protein LOTGIDRAFT_229151 [Lottia gigantea]
MSLEERRVEEVLDAVQSAGGDDIANKDAGDFMFIENGDAVRNEIEKVKSEFRDQTIMLCSELDSLWRLLKDFMRLACPTLICLVSLLLTRFVVAKKFQSAVLSSLLGCAVATIVVYSAPFMMSFNRYRRIRQDRVKNLTEFIKSKETVKTRPEKVHSNTQTSASCLSTNSSDTEVETLRNPSSSSLGSNESDAALSHPSSIEMIGESKSSEQAAKSCQGDCASGVDDVTKTCDCC